jgi:hypothetical protein
VKAGGEDGAGQRKKREKRELRESFCAGGMGGKKGGEGERREGGVRANCGTAPQKIIFLEANYSDLKLHVIKPLRQ